MSYLIIIFVCLAVYSLSINYEPVVDDKANRRRRVENPKYSSNRSLFQQVLMRFDGRYPVKSVKLDRLITIAIHTTVCVLIYYCFKSLPASLLFAVNVSNNQTSLWLNGKRYGLNAIICLLAYGFAPIGFVLLLLVPFLQASAMTFPVFLALNGYWYILAVIPLALLIGNRYILRRMEKRAKIVVSELKDWKMGKICFILKTLAFYFFRGLIPFTPVMYISYLKHYGLRKSHTDEAYRFDLMAFAGLLILALIPASYLLSPQIFTALMWWLITMAVYSNWITVTVIFAERYCYLPNVGLMVALGLALNMIHPFAWLFVFGIYLARLITYMPMYKNMDNYFIHHTNTDPTHDCAWNTRISDALFSNDIFKALRLTDESLTHIDNSPRLWIHKAALVRALRGKKEAEPYFLKAREVSVEGFSKLLAKIDEIEILTEKQGE